MSTVLLESGDDLLLESGDDLLLELVEVGVRLAAGAGPAAGASPSHETAARLPAAAAGRIAAAVDHPSGARAVAGAAASAGAVPGRLPAARLPAGAGLAAGESSGRSAGLRGATGAVPRAAVTQASIVLTALRLLAGAAPRVGSLTTRTAVADGVRLDGTTSTSVFTPQFAGMPEGDATFVFCGAADNWTGSNRELLTQHGGVPSTSRFRFIVTSAGQLQLQVSDGTTFFTHSATVLLPAVGVVAGQTVHLKATIDIDNGVGGRTVRFYYSLQPAHEAPSWVPLGDPVSPAGALAALHNSTANAHLGRRQSNASADLFIGTIYYGEIRDGIDGPLVANPDMRSNGQARVKASSFTDDKANVWTLDGNAFVKALDLGDVLPLPAGGVSAAGAAAARQPGVVLPAGLLALAGTAPPARLAALRLAVGIGLLLPATRPGDRSLPRTSSLVSTRTSGLRTTVRTSNLEDDSA